MLEQEHRTGSKSPCSEELRDLQRHDICNLLSSILTSNWLPKKLAFSLSILQPDIVIRLLCDSIHLSLKVGTAPDLVCLLLLLGA